jgi:hypothetical protein
MVTLAVCDPDPLTVAMVMEKSLTIFSAMTTPASIEIKFYKKGQVRRI